MITQAHVKPSHAQYCFENGLSERENGIIKNEYLVDYDIKSVSPLNHVLKKIKNEINQVWPSKVLGYKTPECYAAYVKTIPKAKRPLKIIKIVE